jgi:hypothetical protein
MISLLRGLEREPVLVVGARVLEVELVVERRVGAHRVDAVERAGLGGVALGLENDLAVGRLETEASLAGLTSVNSSKTPLVSSWIRSTCSGSTFSDNVLT